MACLHILISVSHAFDVQVLSRVENDLLPDKTAGVLLASPEKQPAKTRVWFHFSNGDSVDFAFSKYDKPRA